MLSNSPMRADLSIASHVPPAFSSNAKKCIIQDYRNNKLFKHDEFKIKFASRVFWRECNSILIFLFTSGKIVCQLQKCSVNRCYVNHGNAFMVKKYNWEQGLDWSFRLRFKLFSTPTVNQTYPPICHPSNVALRLVWQSTRHDCWQVSDGNHRWQRLVTSLWSRYTSEMVFSQTNDLLNTTKSNHQWLLPEPEFFVGENNVNLSGKIYSGSKLPLTRVTKKISLWDIPPPYFRKRWKSTTYWDFFDTSNDFTPKKVRKTELAHASQLAG